MTIYGGSELKSKPHHIGGMLSLSPLLAAFVIIIIIIMILAANRRRKVQQPRSSIRSNRKLTMAPLAAAILSMCDIGAQLTAR